MHDPATITWQDTERLIKKVASQINYPDREEVEAEARLAFVIAYKTHNPAIAKFSTWLTILTRRRLLQLADAKSKHNRYKKKVVSLEYEPSCEDHPEDWTEKLSSEAKLAIRLVIDDQPDLTSGVLALRRKLKERLTQEGWGKHKINRVFKEIRGALP